MIKHLFIFIQILFVSTLNAQISTDAFIQDIDQLHSLIENKHAAPYWNTTKENLLEVIQNAKRNILEKEICDESCYVELFKVVSALNESHSYISGKSRYELFGYLPMSIKWFEDGLFIVKTSSEYEEILGHKIVYINGVEIEIVVEKLKQVIPHTNSSRIKKYIGSYLHLPGLLYGLGISDSPSEVKFSLEKNGSQIQRIIKKLSPEDENQTIFKTITKSDAYFQKNQDKYYWFDYDSEQKLIYFQYNRIANMDSESSTDFANRLWSVVDSVDIDNFVLDLRYNGGGSFPYSLKFIQGIIDRPRINKRGKLFVITGYDTFSAAITMVNQLEQRTEAIIVGEYPCAAPSHPGDPENYKLKNSNVEVSLSSLYHPTFFEDDRRNATELDKHLALFWEDYNNGIDPSLDFILNFEEKDISPEFPNNLFKYIGTYEYSAIRNMQIKAIDDRLYLEIDGSLLSPLYLNSAGEGFSTEVKGLTLLLQDNYIEFHFPDGKIKKFKRIDPDTKSAIDYLYNGEIQNVENIYLSIKEEDGDYIELKDHQFSFLASIIYFDLRNNPNKDGSSIAKDVLNMGIRLNDGKAPFCEFSLRFY